MVTNVKDKKNTYLLLKPNMHFNSFNEIISTAFISNDGEKGKLLHIKNFNLNTLKETHFKKIILYLYVQSLYQI